MIDAGSSGSRVHVYRFKMCKEAEMENEVFEMLKPGLSSFAKNPQAAAESLDPLMKVALENVPTEIHACTPVAVKATAGLRLLGKATSDEILKAVRKRLETNYPFPVADVAIMDGSDEGVYAWITVNYLLGKLKQSQRGQSAAIFDLGGASTQIVFEPVLKDEPMAEGNHKVELEFGQDKYELYQHSYLGYGLNEARQRIKKEAVDMWKEEARRSHRVYHPCLPNHHNETIEWESQQVELIGTGAGETECRALVERVFNKDKECTVTPCTFEGVYQPPLTDTFSGRDLYIFSYFYDLTQPLGMPTEFSVAELGELAQRVCAGATKPFLHVPGALELLASEPDYCMELSYIHSLLRFGYDIPSERLVRTAKKIRGAETGWCLGASIAMLNEVQTCQST
ncbi:Guanosine-diphosphatase [Apophysomyces sp. BC1034]|nr:Guanosine-diphosphatase [Apophysomyces sp. BC1015]KAG0178426.1 Guanosine-diphosphatase [Apophysomyces sp. BC1021]KAG0194105.1 Guanosine-diphosphatase [Apophysomyces sp. BC1034]